MALLGGQALVDIQGISGILALLSLDSLAPSVPINPIPLIHQVMRTLTLYIVLLWLSNGKVKLYNLVPMLNKWYIRRVLRHDLEQIVPQLVTRDSLTYENPKHHITYRFKPLKPTEDETER